METISQILELFSDCIKILFVDLKTRKYEIIRIPSDELVQYESIDKYWQWFLCSELIHPEDKTKVEAFVLRADVGKTVIYRRKYNGMLRIMLMQLIDYQDKCLLLVKDITDIYNEELNLVVSKVERTDSITGLLNAKAYKDDTAKCSKGNVGVAFIDVNGLKWTNDNKSHAEGNAVISKLVKMLKEQFPAYNIYRIGGDEFVVIGFNVKLRVFLHTVSAFHKRLWNDCSTYTEGEYLGGLEGLVEKFPIASVGYSADTAEDIEDVISDAEKQMYEDKNIFYKKYTKYKR